VSIDVRFKSSVYEFNVHLFDLTGKAVVASGFSGNLIIYLIDPFSSSSSMCDLCHASAKALLAMDKSPKQPNITLQVSCFSV
jgi:hypothetical protein